MARLLSINVDLPRDIEWQILVPFRRHPRIPENLAGEA